MSKKLSATLVLIALITGCQKKSTDATPTKTETISQQSWKYDNAGIDVDKNGTIDYPASSFMQSCTLDNTFLFASNGTGIIDEGATKCNANAPQTSPFTWAFLNNETMISLQSAALFGLGGPFKITTLSSTQFNLSKDTTYMGSAASIIINLKH